MMSAKIVDSSNAPAAYAAIARQKPNRSTRDSISTVRIIDHSPNAPLT